MVNFRWKIANGLQEKHLLFLRITMLLFLAILMKDADEGTERISLNNGHVLRYGENPHQKATFFKFKNTPEEVTLSNAKVLQGKALSYNNMLDADAAWKSASDAYHSVNHIENKVAVSVIKHLNPCGLAVTGNILESLELGLGR